VWLLQSRFLQEPHGVTSQKTPFFTSRLVCSAYETMAESLSVASTAVLSAITAVIDSVEVGRSAVYNSVISALGHCRGVHVH
jgi:hypothetical protein